MLRVPVALFAAYAIVRTCESALQEGYALSGSPVVIGLLGAVLFLLTLSQRRGVERSRRLYAEHVVD